MKPNNVNMIYADVKKNIQTAAQLLQGLQFKLLSQEESAVWTVPSPEEVKDDLLEVLTSSLCSYHIWFRKHFRSFHFMKRAPTWCGVVLLWSLNEWPLHLLLSLSLIDLLFKEIKHFFFSKFPSAFLSNLPADVALRWISQALQILCND